MDGWIILLLLIMYGETGKFPTGVGCLVQEKQLGLELHFGQFTCESTDWTRTRTSTASPWRRIFDLYFFFVRDADTARVFRPLTRIGTKTGRRGFTRAIFTRV